MIDRKTLSVQTNNRGVTLIELIVTMAITGIVLIIVTMIIAEGSRSYKYGQQEVNLQMQVQAVVNQFEDIIIEAYWMEEKEISSDVTVYFIYTTQGDRAVIFDKSQQMLFYLDGIISTQINNLEILTYTKAANLMASNIKELSMEADSSTLLMNQGIQMKITFENNGAEYSVEKIISFRNEAAPTPTIAPIPPAG